MHVCQFYRYQSACLHVVPANTWLRIKVKPLEYSGVQAHPLRATLLNIAFGMRVQNYQDIGYFPIMEYPPRMSADARRRVKLFVISKCLSELLRSAKDFSNVGKIGLIKSWHTGSGIHGFSNEYVIENILIMPATSFL